MTTGMTADEIAAAVAAVNALSETTDPATPDPGAVARARRKLERAEAKRARRAEKLAGRAEVGAIGTAAPTDGVRKVLQFGMKFDALLSPQDAETFARRHLESVGLRVHDCYATGVRKSDTRVLKPDQTQALEEYEFHADVTIPVELMEQFAAMAESAAAEEAREPTVRNPEAGDDIVEAGSRPS